jgi:hypothetical protein
MIRANALRVIAVSVSEHLIKVNALATPSADVAAIRIAE